MTGPFGAFVNGAFVNNDALLNPTNARIDPTLYASYDVNDLRKVIFFKGNTGAGAGTYKFTGNYDGTPSAILFDGIANIDHLTFQKPRHLGKQFDRFDHLNRARQSGQSFQGPFFGVDQIDLDEIG